MDNLVSAGLLMFSKENDELKFFLVHPGGPFFTKKDDGYWSIPKGLPNEREDFFDTAKREFKEETGIKPEGEFILLDSVKQKSGKIVHAWAFQTELNEVKEIKSNTFNMEWPPKSGKIQSFPEIDKGEFFDREGALKKINTAQAEFIFRLEEILEGK